jgi:hypothetical protein
MHQLNQGTGKKIFIFLQLKEFLFSVMTAILECRAATQNFESRPTTEYFGPILFNLAWWFLRKRF